MTRDVEIGAAARAKRVKFLRAPDTEVRLAAGESDEAESRSMRENLPEKVEPGVDYEDVYVEWGAGVEIEGRKRKRKES